jgi:ribosomal protein S12 methylthiotransferase
LIKFFLDQHGCAKNQVDGELLVSVLTTAADSADAKKTNSKQSNAGCKKTVSAEQTFNPAEADLIIINSCGFIESAKKESLNAVIAAKKKFPKAKIILAGCLAERYADVLKEQLPEADGIFGNGDLSRFDEVVLSVMKGKKTVLVPEQKGVCCGGRNMLLSFPGAAYVKITEGCNNHCTFCAIPIIRGDLRSRKAAEISKEIKQLVAHGVYELNLIGQDLAAYGTGAEDDVFGAGRASLPFGTPGSAPVVVPNSVSDASEKSAAHDTCESALCGLLKQISALAGTFRVRLLYIHPDHFNRDILPIIKSDPRILPYFDIPFQSGDDIIIKSMNRVGSRKIYEKLIADIREVLPDAAIRTTFLTGFPGESDDAAKQTELFLKKIRTDWSGCFPYSKEDATPGAKLKNQVPKKIAQARADALVALQSKITKKKLAERVGKEYDVLIEEVIPVQNNKRTDNDASDEVYASDDSEGLAIGRAWFQAPEVDGSVVVRYDRDDKKVAAAVQTGRLVRVHVTSSGDVDLDGEFICDSELNKTIKKSKLQFAQNFSETESE